VLTNSEVFDIFTLPFVKKVQQEDLLEDKNSIVISQDSQEKSSQDRIQWERESLLDYSMEIVFF